MAIETSEILTSATVMDIGHYNEFYRQAGWNGIVPFNGEEVDVHLVAQGVGERLSNDTTLKIELDSRLSHERWVLKEDPMYLRYNFSGAIGGKSIISENMPTKDSLHLNMRMEKQKPGKVLVTHLDINEALSFRDPAIVLEFLHNMTLLTTAIHSEAAHLASLHPHNHPRLPKLTR